MTPVHGKPRSFCDRPAEFGKSENAAFIEAPFPDPDTTMPENARAWMAEFAGEAQAAAIQHEVALAINRILTIDHITHAAYGRLVGLDERRIGAILRGDLGMYLHEFEIAKRCLPGLETVLRVRFRRAQLARTYSSKIQPVAPLDGYRYITLTADED
ncbi:hypothetical protein FB562_0458 [Homoserinimonas aerilata]|uniref:Uncharacterized protein n=1 Tax=Homoserinimonas aerilata TaxID=1162970 RepID=A0A542YH21_9MICO|nr:hypothetical protein [Homoserinimonas aerilata]TQL47400.1 hypothetical protein FB562_0458 [Homoserinimonas aerilata]